MKKSPVGSWRSFFNLGKSSSVSKRKLQRNESEPSEMKAMALKGWCPLPSCAARRAAGVAGPHASSHHTGSRPTAHRCPVYCVCASARCVHSRGATHESSSSTYSSSPNTYINMWGICESTQFLVETVDYIKCECS